MLPLTMKTARRRGRPIYVRSGNMTISLVPEIAVRELRFGYAPGVALRSISPAAVFVIDDQGVTRLAVGGALVRKLAAMMAVALAVPMLFLLVSRISRRQSR